jgi:hypothetical protein
MEGKSWIRHQEPGCPMTGLEIAVKVLGARFPVAVAAIIGTGCRDVPAAVAALREREPHWFEPIGAADQMAPTDRAPTPLIVRRTHRDAWNEARG